MPHNTNAQCELVLLTEDIYETPDPNKALEEPEGLSAVGGDLSAKRLIHLYTKGFFPWYSDPDPILWWHPKERCTLTPSHFHPSKSLKKALKRGDWSITVNQNFHSVINYCAKLRVDKEGTWISQDITKAYSNLHNLGYAHSIEARLEGELVGGFYGVALGNMFFGESMFSLSPNASKIALYTFCQHAPELGIELIDCQVESSHLLSLGAELIPRCQFVEKLERLIDTPSKNLRLNKVNSF